MSINKVILIGNVGKDPDVKHLDGGKTVANFSLATTEKGYKTKDGREIPNRTDWHSIVTWGGLAKVVEKYVKKGSQLYIEGKIRTREYEKDGVKRYVTEIYVDTLQLLGSKPTGERPDLPSDPVSNAPSEVEDDLPF